MIQESFKWLATILKTDLSKFILYKFCITIWAVPSLHYGIVYTLLDTAPKIGTETCKICIGRAQPQSVTETTPLFGSDG